MAWYVIFEIIDYIIIYKNTKKKKKQLDFNYTIAYYGAQLRNTARRRRSRLQPHRLGFP